MSIFRKRDVNEFRWRRGAWRNGHGDVMRGGVMICGGELPDGFVPPIASLGPVASRGHVLVSTAMIPPPFEEPPPPPILVRHSTCPNCGAS